MTPIEKLTYTTDEAAKAIGISRSMLYRLIDRQELRRVKVGSRTLIRVDELRRYLLENEH